jgi:hypothetical protein
VTLADRKQLAVEEQIGPLEGLSTLFLHDRRIPVTNIALSPPSWTLFACAALVLVALGVGGPLDDSPVSG